MEEVLETLKKLDIKYELINHVAVYNMEDTEKIDSEEIKKVENCKSLFLRDEKKKRFFLIVILDSKKINIKKLQDEIGVKRLSFASKEDLNEILGLIPGAVTPMGVINDKEKKVEVLIDKRLSDIEEIAVHPNVNTASIIIKTKDLEKYISHFGNKINIINLEFEKIVYYTVDRIEENICVLENRETLEMINVEKNKLPEEIQEGTILRNINEKFLIDRDYEDRIKKRIENKTNDLWE